MKHTHILLLLVLCSNLFLDHSQLFAKKSKDSRPPSEMLDQDPDIVRLQKQVNKLQKQLNDLQNLAYGSWLLPGDSETTVRNEIPIFFTHNMTPESSIVHDKGVFTLPADGIYMITFGLTSNHMANMFEIQLSGILVQGGKISAQDGGLFYATGAITVVVNAKAGEHLQIMNASGSPAKLGMGERGTASAYVSIVQLR